MKTNNARRLLTLMTIILLGFIVSTAEAKNEDRTIKVYGGPVVSNAVFCQFMNTSNNTIEVTVEVYCTANATDCPDNPTLDWSSTTTLDQGQMTWQTRRVDSGFAQWRCELTYWGRPGQIKGTVCNEFGLAGNACTPLED